MCTEVLLQAGELFSHSVCKCFKETFFLTTMTASVVSAHPVYVQVAAPSSGRRNYHRSKEGSQVSTKGGGQGGWINKTSDFNSGGCCLVPVNHNKSISWTTWLLLQPWRQSTLWRPWSCLWSSVSPVCVSLCVGVASFQALSRLPPDYSSLDSPAQPTQLPSINSAVYLPVQLQW